ncbi:MAG: helix-hairpin-helix domain-containing protein [Acidobacteriaceae bacterium]|nr:helix-hairpin-helix domain-containing protein [Acidobacteriaceae bacterium]
MNRCSLPLFCLLLITLSLAGSCSTKSVDARSARDKKVQEPVTRYAKKEAPQTMANTGNYNAAKPVPVTLNDPIDVNSATEFELETLPGISPADAETIIENRPYRTREELLVNGVIAEDVYARIKDRITTK